MSTRRALAFSFADRYAGLFIHMATSIVIARLLTPSDIGVFSIAMVLIGFIATFRDLGAGQYIVQKQRLVEDDARAVWTVQLGLGLSLAAIIAAASLPAAIFYREPRIQGIMMVIALNFAVTPLLAFPNAWLVREMRFGVLATVRFSSAIATAIFAIGFALAGLGPISLAWGNLAGTLAGVVAIRALANVRLPWRPKLAGIKEVVTFGSKITLVSLLMSINSSLSEVFLGKLQGMTDTGLFSRARGLVAMFDHLVTSAAGAVTFPYFAKQVREGRGLKDSFLHGCALITVLGWSFLGCLAILAYPTIRLLYGDQWDQAVAPTRWLAAAGLFGVPASICLAPLIASGAISKVLRVVALGTCINAVFAGVGAYFGLLTLTKLLVPCAAVWMAMWLMVTKRQVGFHWAELFKTFGRSSTVAIATVSIPLAVTLYLGWSSPGIFLTLSIAVPGAAAGFLAASYFSRHPIWAEILNAMRAFRAQ